MIQTLAIILAHGKVQETVVRHLPVWAKVAERVIIASPADDPVCLRHEWGFVTGKSARYAEETNQRTMECFELAKELSPRLLIWMEYDALLWEFPPMADMMSARSVMGTKFTSADRSFKGAFYLHSPIIFGSAAIRETLLAMCDLPPDAERGFGDRFIGLAVELARLPVIDAHAYQLAFSKNHIEKADIPDAVQARRKGAVFMHGIKEAAVFQAIQAAKP
ncbi:hypothetical protein [Thiocapsa sp. N5-Cardenillas]|uniref:hypothetical protein n=1 Tax=Thiocapsa sp. N5-Cardenillas TaxID=3137397 RepID=UPI0035B41E06